MRAEDELARVVYQLIWGKAETLLISNAVLLIFLFTLNFMQGTGESWRRYARSQAYIQGGSGERQGVDLSGGSEGRVVRC